MESVSLYRDYPEYTRSNLYVFRIVSGSNSGKFSGLVPETLRRSCQDKLGVVL